MSPCPSLHVEQSVQLCPVRVCKRTEWRNARERNANFRNRYYQCVYPAGRTKVQNAWIDTHTPTGINICWQSVIKHAQMVLLARLLPVNCSTIFLKKMMLNFRKFSKNSGWHGTIVKCIWAAFGILDSRITMILGAFANVLCTVAQWSTYCLKI